MTIFTHHIQFWVGLFAGGMGGYLWGAVVKASVQRELDTIRAVLSAKEKAASEAAAKIKAAL